MFDIFRFSFFKNENVGLKTGNARKKCR